MAMPSIDREDVEDSGDVQRGRRLKCDMDGVRARLPTKKARYRRMTRQVGDGAAGLNVRLPILLGGRLLTTRIARSGYATTDAQLSEQNPARGDVSEKRHVHESWEAGARR
jgi:hypothetical protein